MRGRGCSLAWMRKWRDFLADESISNVDKAELLCFAESEVSQLMSAIDLKEGLQKKLTNLHLSEDCFKKNDTSELEWDKVSPTHYRALRRAPKNKQIEIALKISKENLTVRQTQQIIRELKGEKTKVSDFYCGVEWCDYKLNIYLGCGHGCTYCYGRLMNEQFNWVDKWEEPIKRNIDLEDLAKKLDELDKGSFFFCSVCDAYQPLNKELDWAREVLEVLLESKHHIIILTKSALVERDLEFIAKYDNVELGFTIICLYDEENKTYEPHSSPPSERIRVLHKAHQMGIKTLVSIEPWIIGHTQPLEIIKSLESTVDRWIIGIANYMGFELEEYRPYLGELLAYLMDDKKKLKFWLKAELMRVIKSYPIMSKKQYEQTAQQQVGDR